MEYITGTTEFHIDGPTVAALGKFDGCHRGHQKIFQKMEEVKAKSGLSMAAFTFCVAPASLVTGERGKQLFTNEERRIYMEQAGMDYLIEYPFTRQVMHMEAEQFVKQVLLGEMNAKAVVVGTDCRFGYQRSGNPKLLEKLSKVYGFQFFLVEKEQDQGRDISSTYIREELELGNVEQVGKLLGRPFCVRGQVVHGRHIGGELLGFPTANLIPPAEKCLPPFGVYVSWVLVDGKGYGGVTNIGKKPTIEGESPVGVETYIFDLDCDLYGKELEVRLLFFTRPERRFHSLEQLREQIGRDKTQAGEYFKKLVYNPG